MFIDDTLVLSKNPERHNNHLRLTLRTLRENTLYVKLSKCEFWLERVAFLGHVVLVEGIGVESQNVEAIMN